MKRIYSTILTVNFGWLFFLLNCAWSPPEPPPLRVGPLTKYGSCIQLAPFLCELTLSKPQYKQCLKDYEVACRAEDPLKAMRQMLTEQLGFMHAHQPRIQK